MNNEIKVKQEFRDKAREFIDNFQQYIFCNFSSQRANNLSKTLQINRNNETLFLQNRQAAKDCNKNLWERVVENIEIRETDYKGTKDVSRMRSVILNRKGDMMKMK